MYTSGRRYARKYVKEYLQKTLSSRPNSGIIVGNITLQGGCFAKMEHKTIYQFVLAGILCAIGLGRYPGKAAC